MSAIFEPAPRKGYPIRLVNYQTLGACCGTFRNHEEAEAHLREQGYTEDQFYRDGNTVQFQGGVNC
jgi:hypothetical protein